MTLPQIFLASLIGIVFCFPTTASGNTLVPTEVAALKQIASTLGKTDWNFSVDPCSGLSGWDSPNQIDGSENWVRCNCSSNGTDCHVASITLKSQNLPGKLPPELVKLPHLLEIELSRNYLNGIIPPQWGSLPLLRISLLGNRLTDSIPKEFGNISTLVSLVVEFNLLSGAIPAELGDLPLIERMFLTSNNFSGELPPTFANLTTLKDFRIGDNQFTGKIPDFIQNWIHLEKLVIQGSGFDGPIPPGIGLLTNMSDLRISDLNGNDTTSATFPSLRNLTQLKYLILRSCNMNGSLPEYPDLGDTTNLKVLDLSFNKLSGEIPISYSNLAKVDYIYLAGNLLSGSIPGWILTTRERVDLSYNNFSKLSDCSKNDVNLFGMSSKGNTSGIVSCLPSSCPNSAYMFHINCGGKQVIFDGNKYEADVVSGEYLTVSKNTNWASSSTGHFMDDNRPSRSFTWEDTSRFSVNNSELYMDARLSAISLTYYGFCLANGNYDVKLHFAEIMFTDDKTYKSLGRRIFDIYIQGERVKKDFNIVDEAGGAGKEIVKNFTAVVNNTALEIRFYYAGKGTNGLPYRGVYGPLISAISVMNQDYVPPLESGNSISVGVVVGIVFAVASFIILLLGILWWRGCLPCKDNLDEDLKGLDLQTGSFTLRQIKAATNNFDAANKIGEGGFGPVYKGLLSDGTIIAVKQLSSKSKQGNREFVNEIGMISALQHPHLVKLYGCCIEGNQLLLVYEYMENNSLARALFGPEEYRLNLDWPTRYKICIGIARGLAYLHEESRLKIVHRDIKATNVLLDKNLNPKISDFGLAKLDEEDTTHISTRIAGTYGYMAPEYAMRGYLTDKADVYSFGIVALEIVCGRPNTSYRPKEDNFYLLDWALVLKQKGNLMELVDRTLGSNFNKKEVMVMIHIALQCTNVSPAVRPIMSSVVSMLESRTVDEVSVLDPTASSEEMEMKRTSMIELQCIPELKMSESLIQSMSLDGPWTASSASTSDLYPVNLNSDYLANRN